MKHQMTGMLGVYLVAAELTNKDFIVSPTSRSAIGADLLVTNQDCTQTWSVQVKTNRTPAKFWLMSANYRRHDSETHIYVFVNIRDDERPDYIVVRSSEVVQNTLTETTKPGSVWHSFPKTALEKKTGPTKWETEGWSAVFGSSGASIEGELHLQDE